ncbi:MAG: hypothetical protein ACYTEQ_19675 [Planctomycetota bacterium]|jgi:hypothetical protein
MSKATDQIDAIGAAVIVLANAIEDGGGLEATANSIATLVKAQYRLASLVAWQEMTGKSDGLREDLAGLGVIYDKEGN